MASPQSWQAHIKTHSISNPQVTFLVGAQKSGTTSLAYMLAQHPDICLSDPKEPHYFSANHERGPEWYLEHFKASQESILLDASPSYTMASEPEMKHGWTGRDMPARIHAAFPEAKFIYILRDPVDRAYSSYWHDVRGGSETRPLRKAIEERGAYTAPGLYCQQIEHFLRYFKLENFHIISFEDFSDQPEAVAHQAFSFLDLPRLERPFTGPVVRNQSFQYSGLGQRVRNLAGSRERMETWTHLVKKIIPTALWPYIKSTASQTVPPLTPEDRAWLTSCFSADTARLNALLGKRSPFWGR